MRRRIARAAPSIIVASAREVDGGGNAGLAGIELEASLMVDGVNDD